MKKVDHDSRRLEVAEAAGRLIADAGLAGLTTRALAARMGCSIGVLSHYFNNKDEIVKAAFEWADSRIDARMEEVLSQNPTLDSFIPVIQAGLPLDEIRDIEWRVRFNLYSHMLAGGEESDIVGQREKRHGFRTLLAELLNEMRRNGGIRSDIDTTLIASIAFDLVIGAAQNLLTVPMAERAGYTQPIFDLVEFLRPEKQRS